MLSVALIGPDGSGKTTVAQRLAREQQLPFEYVYLGDNPAAMSHALPTTRLYHRSRRAIGQEEPEHGPRDPDLVVAPPRSRRGRAMAFAKKLSWLLVTVSEEWNVALRTRQIVRSGRIALLDRHPLWDYWAYDVTQPADWAARLHGRVIRRLPQPDVVVLLDAPGEVLFGRKGEGSPELLDRRRRDYQDVRMAARSEVIVVDVTRDLDVVVGEVLSSLRARVSARGPSPARG